MIPFRDIKPGDWVRVNNEGRLEDGEVTHVNMDEGQVGVRTPGDIVFYFEPDQVSGIPLDDSQLQKLKFVKEETPEGYIKYKHGPFRLLLEKPDDFSHSKMWYREDRRQIIYPLMVHQLQNHYREMVNVELTES
ncbi:MAG: hypothetical protein ABIX01_03540 [Chitinophagaceae bacterium]